MLWFWQAVVAMLFLIVIPFLTSVMANQYGVDPKITAFWWMVGVAIGVGLYSLIRGHADVMFSAKPVLIVGGLGITIGAIANILLFKSFGNAPNPGMPEAILACNSVIAVLSTKLLVYAMPNYFGHLTFSWTQAAGAILVVSGILIFKIG